jgi:hypothetical protein
MAGHFSVDLLETTKMSQDILRYLGRRSTCQSLVGNVRLIRFQMVSKSRKPRKIQGNSNNDGGAFFGRSSGNDKDVTGYLREQPAPQVQASTKKAQKTSQNTMVFAHFSSPQPGCSIPYPQRILLKAKGNFTASWLLELVS